MAKSKIQPIAACRAARQQPSTREHLQRIQSQRIAATNHFLAVSKQCASAAASHQATVDLIDLIINRWPDCPLFASMLVDKLMAGDEELQAALNEELR